MQDLTPVGLSKDGRSLVLISAAGEEFAVPVDTRLRAVLRGDTGRLGQLEMKMESALRPRDIQARIRAGESPEDVAAAAQTTVEAIMGFATPVLAERAHVAQTARKASVRRRTNEGAGSARTLGESADQYFSTHKLHDEDVEWDAWRRPDGRWALVAAYAVGGRARRAEFSHDLPGRYVVAENDEARMLTGELRQPETKAAAGPASTSARRLSAVPAQDALPLGDDAIELVRDREEGAPAPADEVTEPETPSEPQPAASDETPDFASRADEPVAAFDPAADTADADWIAADGAAPVDEPVEATPEEQAEAVADPEPLPDEQPEEPAKPARKKGRSSVPSWDEIMFGGGKGE